VFDTMLPKAVQVADPFHVVRLGNTALDECRRRVQNETVGHRGRKDDPLYRARRRLVMAVERLTVDGMERLRGLLEAGDPHREVWFAWNAKEVVRQIYDHTDAELAAAWVAEIARDFTDESMPLGSMSSLDLQQSLDWQVVSVNTDLRSQLGQTSKAAPTRTRSADSKRPTWASGTAPRNTPSTCSMSLA
jgi:Transposase